ncbi:hypothetical protein PV392_09690 [Streptomyces sp. ME03-5709C]|nr:hypothetical protein [Streptomyces sp. ME03-5709C]
MAERRGGGGPDDGRHPPAEALSQAAERYLSAALRRVLAAAGQRLGSVSVRVENDPAVALDVLAQGGRKLSEGKSPARVMLELGGAATVSRLRGRLRALVPGRGRPARALTVVAAIDVGVPLATAYDQWARFDEYGLWAEGAGTVETADDTTIRWKGRLLGIRGGPPMRISEKVVDRRIAWTGDDPRYSTHAVVTFHPLADDLTKVVLTLAYVPRGLPERTAARCRVPARAARRGLERFARFVTLRHAALGDEGPPALAHEPGDGGETYEDENDGEDDGGDDEPEAEVGGRASSSGTSR